jgi:hypothetical protein
LITGAKYWVLERVKLGIETGRIAWAPKASLCTHTFSTIIVELTTQITIEAVSIFTPRLRRITDSIIFSQASGVRNSIAGKIILPRDASKQEDDVYSECSSDVFSVAGTHSVD